MLNELRMGQHVAQLVVILRSHAPMPIASICCISIRFHGTETPLAYVNGVRNLDAVNES